MRLPPDTAEFAVSVAATPSGTPAPNLVPPRLDCIRRPEACPGVAVRAGPTPGRTPVMVPIAAEFAMKGSNRIRSLAGSRLSPDTTAAGSLPDSPRSRMRSPIPSITSPGMGMPRFAATIGIPDARGCPPPVSRGQNSSPAPMNATSIPDPAGIRPLTTDLPTIEAMKHIDRTMRATLSGRSGKAPTIVADRSIRLTGGNRQTCS